MWVVIAHKAPKPETQNSILAKAEEVREPEGEGGDVSDDQQGGDEGQDERHGCAGDLLHRYACKIGRHIEIQGNRGGDGPDGQVHGHHDSEPHGIPAKMPDHGDQDGEKDVVDGDGIEQHPGDQEESIQQQEKKERVLGEAQESFGGPVHDPHG